MGVHLKIKNLRFFLLLLLLLFFAFILIIYFLTKPSTLSLKAFVSPESSYLLIKNFPHNCQSLLSLKIKERLADLLHQNSFLNETLDFLYQNGNINIPILGTSLELNLIDEVFGKEFILFTENGMENGEVGLITRLSAKAKMASYILKKTDNMSDLLPDLQIENNGDRTIFLYKTKLKPLFFTLMGDLLMFSTDKAQLLKLIDFFQKNLQKSNEIARDNMCIENENSDNFWMEICIQDRVLLNHFFSGIKSINLKIDEHHLIYIWIDYPHPILLALSAIPTINYPLTEQRAFFFSQKFELLFSREFLKLVNTPLWVQNLNEKFAPLFLPIIQLSTDNLLEWEKASLLSFYPAKSEDIDEKINQVFSEVIKSEFSSGGEVVFSFLSEDYKNHLIFCSGLPFYPICYTRFQEAMVFSLNDQNLKKLIDNSANNPFELMDKKGLDYLSKKPYHFQINFTGEIASEISKIMEKNYIKSFLVISDEESNAMLKILSIFQFVIIQGKFTTSGIQLIAVVKLF